MMNSVPLGQLALLQSTYTSLGGIAVTLLMRIPVFAIQSSLSCKYAFGITLDPSGGWITGNFTSMTNGLKPSVRSPDLNCSYISKGSSSHTWTMCRGLRSCHALMLITVDFFFPRSLYAGMVLF